MKHANTFKSKISGLRFSLLSFVNIQYTSSKNLNSPCSKRGDNWVRVGTAKYRRIDWMDRGAILSNWHILLRNQLSIQSIHRCFAVQTRTQLSSNLEHAQLVKFVVMSDYTTYKIIIYGLFIISITQYDFCTLIHKSTIITNFDWELPILHDFAKCL